MIVKFVLPKNDDSYTWTHCCASPSPYLRDRKKNTLGLINVRLKGKNLPISTQIAIIIIIRRLLVIGPRKYNVEKLVINHCCSSVFSETISLRCCCCCWCIIRWWFFGLKLLGSHRYIRSGKNLAVPRISVQFRTITLH